MVDEIVPEKAVPGPVREIAPAEGNKILHRARGDTVGRYVVLRVLGRGGMGVVYEAYDPELDRRIALKLLRLDKYAKNPRRFKVGRDRLLREAQALAQLSHPNVVSAYDVGIIGSDVFVAMELVKGRSLKDWLVRKRPGWKKIVQVMTAAGQGLSAAHRAGLIHRDVKPDNIVVGKDGQVRVLDFGLVRLADAPVEEGKLESSDTDEELFGPAEDRLHFLSASSGKLRTSLTLHGTLVGTPGYMAPEQFLKQVQNEKSDQFGFCSTLYYALYGYRAFSGTTVKEVRKKVIHGKIDPPPADVKIPKWLERIVYRGLSVDADKRYPSMDALLHDLSADPYSRLRRFSLVFAILVLLALGFLGLFGHRFFGQKLCRGAEDRLAGVWDDETRQSIANAFLGTHRPYAEYTTDKVANIIDQYADSWAGMSQQACEATRVHETQSERTLDLRMGCLDRRLAQLRALTGLFAEKPDQEVLDKAVEAALNLPEISVCADMKALTAAVAPPADPRMRVLLQALRPRLDQVAAMAGTGRYKQGLALVSLIIDEAHPISYAPFLADAYFSLAQLQKDLGKLRQVESALRETLHFAAAAGKDKLMSRAWNMLLENLAQRGQFKEAKALIKTAQVAVARTDQDAALRAALHKGLGRLYYEQGQFDHARIEYERSVLLQQKAYGPEHLRVGMFINELGNTIFRQGNYEQAGNRYREALRIFEKSLGPNHPQVATITHNLGLVLRTQGKYPESLAMLTRAHAIRTLTVDRDSPILATGLYNLGGVLSTMGRFEKSRDVLQQALEIYRRSLGEKHLSVANTLLSLSGTYRSEKNFARALDLTEQALTIYRQVFPEDNSTTAYGLLSLGTIHLDAGHPASAIEPLEKALRLWQENQTPAAQLAQVQFNLARALWSAKQQGQRALKLARQAQQSYADLAPVFDDNFKEIQTWLHERSNKAPARP